MLRIFDKTSCYPNIKKQKSIKSANKSLIQSKKKQKGAYLIEFSVVLPLLFLLILSTLEFGFYIHTEYMVDAVAKKVSRKLKLNAISYAPAVIQGDACNYLKSTAKCSDIKVVFRFISHRSTSDPSMDYSQKSVNCNSATTTAPTPKAKSIGVLTVCAKRTYISPGVGFRMRDQPGSKTVWVQATEVFIVEST